MSKRVAGQAGPPGADDIPGLAGNRDEGVTSDCPDQEIDNPVYNVNGIADQ